MKSKYSFRALSLLLAAAFVFSMGFSAQAEALPDLTRKSTVSVTLKADGDPITGAEITLYIVANSGVKNGNLNYEYTGDFAAYGKSAQSLENCDSQDLLNYAQAQGVSGLSKATNGKGFASFDGLAPGIYLAAQTKSVGGFSDCAPFIVYAPDCQQGDWVYEIDATPKTDVKRLVDITVEKKWNDNGENRPESVAVSLYKGEAILDTVTLNSDNSWSYKWKNMEASDSYSVKEQVPSGYTATYSCKDFDFTVTNTSPLIQTGQLNWPVPVFGAAGIILFAAGFMLYHKRKKASE